MKLQISRAGAVAIAVPVALIAGSVFMPAIGEVLAPSASPSPVPYATEWLNSQESQTAEPTDAPVDSGVDEYVAPRSILSALEAEYRAQVWLQIAEVYQELCLDEGDYGHVQQAIADYTASGDTDIAQMYQDRLDEHNALVDSSNEQLSLLRERLNDVISTHGWAIHDQEEAVYQAKLDRSRGERSIASRLRAAQLGFDGASFKGLDSYIWQQQIDALEKAKAEFSRSRQGF